MATLVAFALIGCGSDGGNGGDANATSFVQVGEDTKFYDDNTTNQFDFNNSVVEVPLVTIPFEGGDFDIKIIPQKNKNLILEENAIQITKKVNGYVVDSEWADILYDIAHKVYIVEGTIHYPYNSLDSNLSSVIEMVYYTNGETKIFQSVNVLQMGNLIELPTVTSNYEKFTVVTDDKGNIVITENAPSDFIVKSITDDDYINIAESATDILVNGVSKPNATLSFVINGNTYSGQADANGVWSITTAGADLALVDTFTITAVGVNEFGETYTETAVSRHQIKIVVNATLTINPIVLAPLDVNATVPPTNTVAVNGLVSGDLTVGHNISLTVGGNTMTTNVIADGSWTIDVQELLLRDNNTTTAVGTGLDIAKNPILETTTILY